MRFYILLIAFVTFSLYACQGDADGELLGNSAVGVWQLTETLADPGDGSGQFRPAEDPYFILISGGNTFVAGVDLCPNFGNPGSGSSGRVDPVNSQLVLDDCSGADGAEWALNYTVNRNEMILWFPCIEPCANKFKRVSASEGF